MIFCFQNFINLNKENLKSSYWCIFVVVFLFFVSMHTPSDLFLLQFYLHVKRVCMIFSICAYCDGNFSFVVYICTVPDGLKLVHVLQPFETVFLVACVLNDS